MTRAAILRAPMWKWRFSLRNLLLAMGAICCLAALVGYELNWIRQRRAFRQHPKFSFVTSPTRAPQLLGLFGEQGVAFMTMEVMDDDRVYLPDGKSQLKGAARLNVIRAHALFPEATIMALDEEGDAGENLNQYWQSPGSRIGGK